MKASLILLLVVFALVNTSSRNYFDGIIEKLNKDQLIEVALTAENLIRKHFIKEQLIGGLHDYIYSLNEQQIRNILLEFVNAHHFLTDGNLLIKTAGYQHVNYDKYISSLKRDKLEKLVIAAEQYEIKRKNSNRIASFHLIKDQLTDQQVKNKLQAYIDQFPELAQNNLIEDIEARGIMDDSEFLEYLSNQNRSTLVHMVVAAESIQKKMLKLNRTGGLFDYVWTLTSETIIDELLSFSYSIPQLYLKGFLEEESKNPSLYVNTMFLGGIGSYVDALTLGEIYYIVGKHPEYFSSRFPFTSSIVDLEPKKIQAYRQAIKQLNRDIPRYLEPGIFEKENDFPIGGLEYYLSLLDLLDLKRIAIKVASSQYAKTQNILYQSAIQEFNSGSRTNIMIFIMKEAEVIPEIASLSYLEYLRKN